MDTSRAGTRERRRGRRRRGETRAAPPAQPSRWTWAAWRPGDPAGERHAGTGASRSRGSRRARIGDGSRPARRGRAVRGCESPRGRARTWTRSPTRTPTDTPSAPPPPRRAPRKSWASPLHRSMTLRVQGTGARDARGGGHAGRVATAPRRPLPTSSPCRRPTVERRRVRVDPGVPVRTNQEPVAPPVVDVVPSEPRGRAETDAERERAHRRGGTGARQLRSPAIARLRPTRSPRDRGAVAIALAAGAHRAAAASRPYQPAIAPARALNSAAVRGKPSGLRRAGAADTTRRAYASEEALQRYSRTRGSTSRAGTD